MGKNGNSRFGAVLKFKEGVSEAEIAKALNLIKSILDLPTESYESVTNKKADTVSFKKVPFRWSHLVHSYDPAWGEPVWYIP